MLESNKAITDDNSKFILKLTLLFLIIALFIFLCSCQLNNPYINPVNRKPLPNMNSTTPTLSNSKQNNTTNKSQEQLYIKREQVNIKPRDFGSSSGSIWADSPSPKNLVTEFKPTKPGDIVTVNIPEDLQYKPDAGAAGGATPTPKGESAKSFKFQVAGIEPGGDVYLRGVKNYIGNNGEERNVVVMAKMPRRNMNNSDINAADLTEVAVSESSNGGQSDYTTTGWDQTVSKKISNFSPDNTAQTASIDAERKDLDTQKKALADQQKSIAEQTDRLKKDRARLDAETARAKGILNAATSVGEGNTAAPSGAQPARAPANAAAAPPAGAGR